MGWDLFYIGNRIQQPNPTKTNIRKQTILRRVVPWGTCSSYTLHLSLLTMVWTYYAKASNSMAYWNWSPHCFEKRTTNHTQEDSTDQINQSWEDRRTNDQSKTTQRIDRPTTRGTNDQSHPRGSIKQPNAKQGSNKPPCPEMQAVWRLGHPMSDILAGFLLICRHACDMDFCVPHSRLAILGWYGYYRNTNAQTASTFPERVVQQYQ